MIEVGSSSNIESTRSSTPGGNSARPPRSTRPGQNRRAILNTAHGRGPISLEHFKWHFHPECSEERTTGSFGRAAEGAGCAQYARTIGGQWGGAVGGTTPEVASGMVPTGVGAAAPFRLDDSLAMAGITDRGCRFGSGGAGAVAGAANAATSAWTALLGPLGPPSRVASKDSFDGLVLAEVALQVHCRGRHEIIRMEKVAAA